MNRLDTQKTSSALDIGVGLGKNPCYIRPLAVRPLKHPEGVPNPWGFSFAQKLIPAVMRGVR